MCQRKEWMANQHGATFSTSSLRLNLVAGKGELYKAFDARFTLGDVLGLHGLHTTDGNHRATSRDWGPEEREIPE